MTNLYNNANVKWTCKIQVYPVPDHLSSCLKPLFAVISNLYTTKELKSPIKVYPSTVLSKNKLTSFQESALKYSLHSIYDNEKNYYKNLDFAIDLYSSLQTSTDIIYINLNLERATHKILVNAPNPLVQASWSVWFEDNKHLWIKG